AGLLLALQPARLPAADSWLKYLSGPFEVYTDAGSRVGRETLMRFEEFREATGQLLGDHDLKTAQPIRILVFRNPQAWGPAGKLIQARDRYEIVLAEKQPIPPDLYSDLTRLFLRDNTSRMPPQYEHGLIEFLSTFESTGVRLTLGEPPPHPDMDWARIHLLVVDPQFYGKIRVLLYNLRQGVDPDAAYQNALGKSPAEIEAQVKTHLAAGIFQATTISGRAMAESDFQERMVSDSDARLARADLLEGAASAAEYRKLLNDGVKMAEANEGLGLLALADHHTDDARGYFVAAIKAGSTSARCYIEYAKLEPDNAKATDALLHAAGINPKLEEPFVLLAQRDTDPAKRTAHWKAATERNPRNPDDWKALAECYLADHDYPDAAKAWRGGEQAATDPAVRDQMRAARLKIEEQRLDYEAAERSRKAAEEATELDRLKAQARAEVHELEVKANGGEPTTNPNAIPWWEGPKPGGQVHGMLKQVDCLGKQVRLVVESANHKIVKLLIPDPYKIAIHGGGVETLGCGAHKPRPVAIEYFPKPNARLATAGEVAMIEFQ
ncbi:MAG TPA: hypothetical protein VME43_00320, partial [Bryobacteraceae bacterium]|nr:hypothetical protein [Bryobacteraceae bacterium]